MKLNFKIILLIIIVIAIGASGIYLWLNKQGESESLVTQEEPTQPKQVDQVDKIKEHNNKIYEQAAADKDANKCLEMIGESEQDSCIRLIAIDKQDKEACSKLNEQSKVGECQDQVINKIAVSSKNLAMCKEISIEYLKSSCTVNIVSAGDYTREQCEQLEEKQKQLCLSHVLFREAILTKDAQLCQEMSEGEGKDTCFDNIFSDYNKLSDCNQYQEVIKTICVNKVASRLAYNNKDKQTCYQLSSDEQVDRCLVMVEGILDPDNDGLTNFLEDKYGTNPAKADTDGDGYNDGDEVKAGYNPKGEGRL